jgi:hypothetical protein
VYSLETSYKGVLENLKTTWTWYEWWLQSPESSYPLSEQDRRDFCPYTQAQISRSPPSSILTAVCRNDGLKKKRSHVCAIISANSCKPNDKLK